MINNYYTFEQAVEKYKKERINHLVPLVERYKDLYTDSHPFYCSHCGWYYPHDNWKTDRCPLCGQDIIQADNSEPTFGLFA